VVASYPTAPTRVTYKKTIGIRILIGIRVLKNLN